MYNSDLTGLTSNPGDPRIVATRYRTVQCPDRFVQDFDPDANDGEGEYFERRIEGVRGRDVEEEISILPDEIELAKRRGYEVSEDDARRAKRVLAARADRDRNGLRGTGGRRK